LDGFGKATFPDRCNKKGLPKKPLKMKIVDTHKS